MKYEDRTAEKLADILGDSGQEEEWTPLTDGGIDFYALIVQPGLGSYIVHEDNYGFFTYDKYRNAKTARAAWVELVAELDLVAMLDAETEAWTGE